jgi:hypothetical protein
VSGPQPNCQWGGDPKSCPRAGTHELIVDNARTEVFMCGPHARDAVITWITQGEKGVSMVQVEGR